MIPPALLKKILFIYCLFLAVLGLRCCTGFSLVVVSGSSLQLQFMGFSYCGAQLEGMWVSVLWHVGSVAVGTDFLVLQYMGSSRIKDVTRVSCIGRQILYH